jgi:hypothetical protein
VGLDDVISGETAFVAALTAAVFSPRTREALRRGAVYGVAVGLKTGDVVVAAGRGVVRGVRGEEKARSSGNGRKTTARSTAKSERSRRSSSSGSRSSRSRSGRTTTKSSGGAGA